MKYFCTIVVFIIFLCLGCSSSDDSSSTTQNTFTDARDGTIYQTVTLGTQNWLAENLNYNTNNNQSVCYDNNSANCFIYGRLYHGTAALSACPEGWHLPSTTEWQILFDYLGGANTAVNLVAPGATLQGSAVNFNLLPAGHKFSDFKDITEVGHYWTSTDGGLPNSLKNVVYTPNVSITLSGTSSLGILKSCRCIKD